MRNDPDGREQGGRHLGPPDGLPRTGEEILREVERLKKEPFQFRCLGLSFGMLLLVLLVGWLLWRLIA